MSIPPLVCSTPPPPDQCDDDKDPEDFDLSYRLSQDEDEDDTYDYGSFSSYSNFQTHENTSKKTDPIIPKHIENEIQKETCNINHNTEQYNEDNGEAQDNKEDKLRSDDDINIEDLNLEVNEEIITSNEVDSTESETQVHNIEDSKETPATIEASALSMNTDSLCYDENTIDSLDSDKDTNSDVEKATDIHTDETNVVRNREGPEIKVESEDKSEAIEFEEPVHLEGLSKESETPPKLYDLQPEEGTAGDDFGDFDDFQFASPGNNTTSVANDCDNPWENNEVIATDFGNFTANFDDTQFQSPPDTFSRNESSDMQIPLADSHVNDDDDDFGDFDDFKSSTASTGMNLDPSKPYQDVPVLNLHSTENEQQIMESINQVLTSIFLEEITEPDSQFEGTLESLLSETWGHLMETDERQPYVINWNNSLGQKTLLRALCIDSRNILFGPKWNTSMPKYAANLSVAPLQPQKPITPNASQNEISNDKSCSKPTTWSDPFTSNGQESCNAENENPVVPAGPTDLDVFEGATSTKSEKIYSTTLSVQPLRQINLPDTHIFTPTDSETPRSKTIHYDSSPTVLLPQSVMSDNKKQVESISNHINDTGKEEDTEYWEFQDFKSSSETHKTNAAEPVTLSDRIPEPTVPENVLTKPNVIFQTQPLQPVKVDPVMPTLNWPEPGEVKCAFDDFSDFVSISASEEKHSKGPDTISQKDTSDNKAATFNDLNDKSEKPTSSNVLSLSTVDFDDDFDTFQSALPTQPTVAEFNLTSLSNSSNQVPSSQITNFDYAFPKINNVKSDTISFPSVTRPNEALTQILSVNSNKTEIKNKTSLNSGAQLKSDILQPTPAAFSVVTTQTQQKMGQILEPLSLESFSQINWPSPGIDLQDLSRFNPVETLQSLKSDLSVSGHSKGSSPVHSQKNSATNHLADDDVWGEFVSSNPKPTAQPKKPAAVVDDDEWTDFISSPIVKPQNGLNTISLNVHTGSTIQKSVMQNKISMKGNQTPLDIPTLNYITPKSNSKTYTDRHFQNL